MAIDLRALFSSGRFTRAQAETLIALFAELSAGGAGGLPAHIAAPDPHPQYLLESVAATTYEPIGAAAAALAAHLLAADPHPQYLTALEADAAYAPLAHTHAIADVTGLQGALDGKQPLDAELTALAGLASAADRLPYFTGAGTAALATLTSFGRSLIDDADASAARITLGLGTMATQSASSYLPLTGGTITGPVEITTNSALSISTSGDDLISLQGIGRAFHFSTSLGSNTLAITNLSASTVDLQLDDTGLDVYRPRIRVGSNVVWHAGNLLNIGTTAASARTALGLGSIATESASNYATVAMAWRTGIYADGPRAHIVGPSADLNTARGFHAVYANGSTNRPSAGNGFVWGLGATIGGTEYGVQEWGRNGLRQFRTIENGTWGSWHEYYHTGNFNPASYVTIAGAETVSGAKTFTSSVTAPTFRASANSFIGGGTFAVLATATGTGAAGQAFLRPDGESSAVGQLAVDLSGVSWGGNTIWHAGNFNPATKQDALGFTPVQQGGGVGQGTNKIYIGWAGSDLLATVDATNLGAIAFRSQANTFSGTNVFTGGYLINRRDIPRVYLESPNQTNGYIIDSNVSNTVYGNLRFLRRDNGTVLAELNNAGDFVAIRTVGGRDLLSRGGTTGTQQIFRTMAYSDGIARLYDVMEADGAYSLYLLDSAGNPAPNAYQKFAITQDARLVQFTAGGILLGSTARTSYQPDATAALSGDLPIHAVANLSANYHNNNLIGVHTTGVYFATDNVLTVQYKSGTTWRKGVTIAPGAAAGTAFLEVDGRVSDVSGNVRTIPSGLRNSTTAFAATDNGKYVYKNNTTAYTWAVNTGVWSDGMTVCVSNRGTAGNVTISRGSGMVLRDGATDVASFTLLPGQSRTLIGVSATEVHIL